MPLTLKSYQQDCLAQLQTFLRRTVELNSPAEAFFELAHRNYLRVDQLPEKLPYVCLRVPTGGGKTILAAYAIPLIARTFLRQDRALVLWLAPTNTIVDQTVNALKNRRHPYREALDAACGGHVSIFTAPEALYLPRPTLDSDTVIIVSTLASLRVTDTEGRKFYEVNGNLMPHFTGLSDTQRRDLSSESDPDLIAPSLANVIRLRRPVVIMDEAHNARTSLSFDTLTRFSPSCVLELTATPSTDHKPQKNLFASNVLHSVSALELKEEAMIKLPIKVRCQPQWRTAVQEALARRHQLEDTAKQEQAATGEYIRPIILFQAQNESAVEDTITPEKLRQSLMDDFKIPADQIAIATGKKDELDTHDITSPGDELRYIITVQKLREGWDCPFAYVLCTIANISSSTAVEQILGRVLRLPQARRKLHDQLNHAYAFVTSADTHATTLGLTELLEEKAGFSHFDASVSVVAEPTNNVGPLFSDQPVVELEAAPNLAPAPIDLKAKVVFDAQAKTLTWDDSLPMTDSHLKVLQKCVSTEHDKKAIDELCEKSRGKSLAPGAQGLPFVVPQFALRADGQTQLFEDQFREAGWDIAHADASLTEAEFAIAEHATQTAIVDIAKDTERLKADFITETQNQIALFDRSFSTLPQLVAWMGQQTPAPDLTHADKAVFLQQLVQGLIERRHYSLEQLISARFTLLDAAARKIDGHRRHALRESFQHFLLPDCATPIEVSPNVCFEFPLRSVYPAPSIYMGAIQFKKHYYKNVAAMNAEEASCALLIDSDPRVKFWVRNRVRTQFGFWLPTSSDRFYPDFVALLIDGRFLVIEYKGAHLAPEDVRDSAEKQMVGQLWEARSGGKCLFRMLTMENMEPELRGIN